MATEKGTLFCSTEALGPCHDLFERERATNVWVPTWEYGKRVEFHYSTEHIFATTARERLRDGGYEFSIIGVLAKAGDATVVIDPLVIGSPWLEVEEGQPYEPVEWYHHEFFEHFVEDFDEFARVRDTAEPSNPEPMRSIRESAFKTCLAKILGDVAPRDWGGESSDFYSAHIRLQGKRKTAAFLLKGPAHFEPMGLNHLGKNNDQIVRLAKEPAQVLFVQHCHDILPPVRETLKAFAVQPSRARRYCLIDGRDSLRLLEAYGLYQEALALSRQGDKAV